jgi:hypothetical protein
MIQTFGWIVFSSIPFFENLSFQVFPILKTYMILDLIFQKLIIRSWVFGHWSFGGKNHSEIMVKKKVPRPSTLPSKAVSKKRKKDESEPEIGKPSLNLLLHVLQTISWLILLSKTKLDTAQVLYRIR